jgi:hypothetical protein
VRLFLTVTVLIATLIVTTAPSRAQTACQAGEIPARFDVLAAEVDAKQANLVLRIGSFAAGTVDGILLLHVEDGGAPERLMPDSLLNISCSDIDGDGVAGIVQVDVALLSRETVERFVVTIVPESEVEETGRITTAIRVSGESRQIGWTGRPIWVTDLSNPARP